MKDSRMRDEDGFLTEHDPKPKFPLRPPEEDIETGRCSRCHENVSFTGGMSDCCGERITNEEPPSWMEPDDAA